jgi:pimeloyl-ACP methyl ester carboxylesterase
LFSWLSLAILLGAAYLLWSWQHGYDWRGADGLWRHSQGAAWRLYMGGGLLAWSAFGRFIVLATLGKRSAVNVDPKSGRPMTLTLADGSVIAYEVSGRLDGPTLLFTHGWGLDRTVWAWAKRDLGDRFRLVTWDLPGLGASRGPTDGRYTIDRFAQALGALLETVSERPAILVGHSIGGMTVQTLFRALPEIAKAKVAGVVLLDTTYENPTRTMWLSPLWRALQRPLLEPLSWLTVGLSPIIWMSNWQSYFSGTAHLAMRLTGFGRRAPRDQVDLTARLACQGNPAVQAKGNLAMFHWSVLPDLARVTAPVLVLTGTRDIVTMPAAGDLIGHRVPVGEAQLVEGAGHMGFIENFGAYNKAIETFAETALRTPRGGFVADDIGRSRSSSTDLDGAVLR